MRSACRVEPKEEQETRTMKLFASIAAGALALVLTGAAQALIARKP